MHIKNYTALRRQQIAYSVAFAAILGSFMLWTTVVTHHVVERYYVAANETMPTAESVYTLGLNSQSSLPLSVDPPPAQKSLPAEIVDVTPVEPPPAQHTAAPAAEELHSDPPSHPPPFEASLLSEWELEEHYTISIPAIGVQAPVFMPSRKHWNSHQWDMLEEQMQVGLRAGAVAYPHSVPAGANGSLIIAGHSSPPNQAAAESPYGELFARLPELGEGGVISVLSKRGFVDYEVVETQIVSPYETSILAHEYGDSVLKLITCYPVGTTKDRWVVVAKRKVAT